MKPSEMWSTLAVAVVLGFLSAPTSSVPIVPGWEEEPTKYQIEIFAVCDFHCVKRFMSQGSARNEITEVIRKASLLTSQLGVELVLVGMDIWNELGWTNWTTPVQDFDPQFDWIGRQAAYYRQKTFFDQFFVFTAMRMNAFGTTYFAGENTYNCMHENWCYGVVKFSDMDSSSDVTLNVAHEIGHGFGFAHDGPEDQCQLGDNNCIMHGAGRSDILMRNPQYAQGNLKKFKQIIQSTKGVIYKKPVPPAAAQLDGARCGNGIIEPGEQCDCGTSCLPQGCCNCCKDCKLVNGAQCASGKCCNSQSCKFKSNGTVCRKSMDGFCDSDDVCTGKSSECENKRLADWTDCTDFNNEDGYCKDGFCNTINTQCRFVWNKGYKTAADNCFKKAVGAKNFATSLNADGATKDYFKCKTLICEKDKKNATDDIPKVRNPRGGNDCLVGDYWAMEKGLLGLSGVLLVEDGTKCGPDSACLAGDCLPKTEVMNELEKKVPFQRKTAYCGNGKIEPGEDCDCGPNQCACCNVKTCKFSEAGYPCLKSCGVCNGRSTDCTTGEWAAGQKSTDYKPCFGTYSSMCYDGTCADLLHTCQKYFKFAMPASMEGSNNFKKRDSLFNAGGFILYDGIRKEYEEFRAGEDDGVCGIAHCKARMGPWPYVVKYPNGTNTTYATKELQVSVNDFTSVLYYQSYEKQDVNIPGKGKRSVAVSHPALILEGTPCILANKKDGYCRTMEATSDQIPSIKYYYSKCSELPEEASRSTRNDFYPFST